MRNSTLLSACLIAFFISLFSFIAGYFFAEKESRVIRPIDPQLDDKETPLNIAPTPAVTSDWGWQSNCQYKLKLRNPKIWTEGQAPYLTFCPQWLFLDVQGGEATYKVVNEKSTVLDSTETFPGLFYTPLIGYNQRLPHTSETWQLQDGVVVLVDGFLSTGSWSPKATAIYYIHQDYSVDKVYKLDDSKPGYWAQAEVIGTNPLTISETFALSSLSCHSCTIEWENVYEWNTAAKTLTLVNNKYPQRFKELLSVYEKQNETECDSEQTMEELYYLYPQRDKVCGDEAYEPTPTRQDVRNWLQAKITIERVIAGENLSHEDVAKEQVD